MTLFPFEAEIYRRLGADAVCAGHPLVDDVREGLEPLPPPRPRKTRRRLVLLPGSRVAEVRRHWEPMARGRRGTRARGWISRSSPSARRASEDSLFPGATSAGFASSSGNHYPLSRLGRPRLRRFRNRDARGGPLRHADGRRLPDVRVRASPSASACPACRWISLVNIVAGEEVVPELLQEQVNANAAREEGAALLDVPAGARAG